MKRSEVNTAIEEAEALLRDLRWSLPEWAAWDRASYAKHPDLCDWLQAHQMGWDVTDFGSGDFANRGLTLFCLRNGRQGDASSVPYAEKLLFVNENQETPFHTHKKKMEDIINRGGGDLIIEFRQPEGVDTAIALRCDGVLHHLERDDPLSLKPGKSVTIPCGIYHRFYARAGGGMVLGGEVSQVNDDGSDNYFLEPVGRFSTIEEDAPPKYPLWNEVGYTA